MLDFCNEINNKKPLFVDVCPTDNALVHECIDNVSEYIKVNGGERVTGWAIWILPNVFREAEYHEICKINNKYIDVTPRKYPSKRILFLQDLNIKHEGYQINNIRKPLKNLSCVQNYIELFNKKFEILNNENLKNKFGLLKLSGRDSEQMNEISNKIVYLSHEIQKYVEVIGPYQPCPCGCGKKRKW